MKEHRYLTIGLAILVLAGIFHIIPAVLKETVLKWYPLERDELALQAREAMKAIEAMRPDMQGSGVQKPAAQEELRRNVHALVARYSTRDAQVHFLDFAWDLCQPIRNALGLIGLVFLLAELIVSAIGQLPESQSGAKKTPQ